MVGFDVEEWVRSPKPQWDRPLSLRASEGERHTNPIPLV
jgi:hypothetical protein